MLSNPRTKRQLRFEHVFVQSNPPPTPPSPKRRKTYQDLSTDSPDPSPTAPKGPPTLDIINQSNKVIWVDLGIDSDQTYWWPALVYGSDPDSYASLIPDSKSGLVDITPRLLSACKATKPFQTHSNFQPIKLNPILEDENLRSHYPSLESLQEAYVIGREKHVIYSFQEDDDLPDLSTCVIPLSQESRALLANVLSQDQHKRPSSPEVCNDRESEPGASGSSAESSADELDLTFDQPDLELDIPGETVLSRTNSRSQHYWPARILSYEGLKIRKKRGRKGSNKCARKPKKDKMYQLEFFDGSLEIVPRSKFWTTDQDEFYQVEMGRVVTEEVNFQEVIPQIAAQFEELDKIIGGKSNDKEAMEKHENFFASQSSVKSKRDIPQDVKYAKYGEELIHKMGQVLIKRYLSGESEGETEKNFHVDERFEKLTEAEKSRYVFDILVPQLIWLITVRQYIEDAKKELRAEELKGEAGKIEASTDPEEKERSEEKILQRAKKLTSIVIQEVDLIDKVTSLRVRKTRFFQDNLPITKQRNTYNSRKTFEN